MHEYDNKAQICEAVLDHIFLKSLLFPALLDDYVAWDRHNRGLNNQVYQERVVVEKCDEYVNHVKR